ncbi:MAG: hypothetical protein ACXVDD_28700 [Polyangia bacterium]
MRWLMLGVICLAACGGDGGGGSGGAGGGGGGGADATECAQLSSQLAGIVRAHQTCTVDSDCHWVADGCLGLCNTFVNSDGAAAALDVVQSAAAAGCNAGCYCNAQLPACNGGICGARQQR